jgi:transcriptional regulator with XRE-family HTH domain
LNKPFSYWAKGLEICFDLEKHTTDQIDLGTRLKTLRTRQGLSQTGLAKMVGVTPSTISQVESNLIYPSLPALFKMAEVLSINVSALFQEFPGPRHSPIFPPGEAVAVKFPDQPRTGIRGKLLIPVGLQTSAEPYLIEIPPKTRLSSHFFSHKGQEFGYLLSGELEMRAQNGVYTAKQGDVIYLKSEMPSQWKNKGDETARLLWVNIK